MGFYAILPYGMASGLGGRWRLSAGLREVAPGSEGWEAGVRQAWGGLGVKQVAKELERYGALFPAAADRLRLRLYGDAEGQWGWSVLAERLESPSFAADVQLVTRLAARQPTAIDQEAQIDELRSRAFEAGL